MPGNHYSTTQIINAIRASRGMISLAAKGLGCHPDTIRKRSRLSVSIGQALREEREQILDIGELALFKAVQGGEAWAVCFLLKTLGKQRGYVERQEMTGAAGGPIELSLVELAKLAAQNGEPIKWKPAEGELVGG